MTDKQKLTALLDEFGIKYTLKDTNVICEEGDTKISGYSCFYTIFKFNESEEFIEMGAYE